MATGNDQDVVIFMDEFDQSLSEKKVVSAPKANNAFDDVAKREATADHDKYEQQDDDSFQSEEVAGGQVKDTTVGTIPEEKELSFEVEDDLDLVDQEDMDDERRRSTSEIYRRQKKPRRRSSSVSSGKKRRRSAPEHIRVRRRSSSRKRSSVARGAGGRRAVKKSLGKDALSVLESLDIPRVTRLPLGRHNIATFKSIQRSEKDRQKNSKNFTMVLAEYTFDWDSKMKFVHGDKFDETGDGVASSSLDSETSEDPEADERRLADLMQFWLSHPRSAKTRYRDTFGYRALKTEKSPAIFCSVESKKKAPPTKPKSAKSDHEELEDIMIV